MSIFTNIIDNLMAEKNITFAQLAREINIGKNSMAYWQNRDMLPKGDTLKKLADYFNVSTDYLLGKTDERNPQKKEQLTPEEQADKKLQDQLLSLYMDLDDEGKRKLKEQAELLALKHKK